MYIPKAEAEKPISDAIIQSCMQNRELSWLQFNERVLEEADAAANPLLERFFFLSIFTSNLDEFFMIRVGGLCDHAQNKTGAIDNKTGMNAAEQLDLIYSAAIRLYVGRDAVCGRLESELAKEGVERLDPHSQTHDKKTQRAIDAYFENQLRPLLAPQIIDQSHPFPHLENNRQFIALCLETKGGKYTHGLIPVPNGVERMFFPADDKYMLIEDIIFQNCDRVFKRYKVSEKAIICVTRNADIVAGEERFDEDEDFRDHMRKLLKKRKRLSPVRLEVRGEHCPKLVSYLQKKLSLTAAQTFFSISPLEMSFYLTLRDKTPPQVRRRLSYTPFEPAAVINAGAPGDILKRVRLGDVLLSHPYDSIQPFVSLIRDSADDAHVLSIQIALYRIAEQAKLVDYLIMAAENDKEVFVFIELRARMDEEKNIALARRMEEAGCHVFYGPAGFKLHAKICLITRREGVKNEYVTHIGTGNFNEKTARLYTDLSIITVNEAIGRDASHFFHNLMIGAHDDTTVYSLLKVAPQSFKPDLIDFIRKEAALGDGGRIVIKCNSLTDRDVIIALIDASCAGVSIDLIIRGICCLRAQLPGLTENIRVRSIVGRFLEHSRIYRFGAAENYAMYIGSGDMMTRNTERRIELFAPVLDAGIRRRVSEMLDVMLADNVKAREMGPDGLYRRVRPTVYDLEGGAWTGDTAGGGEPVEAAGGGSGQSGAGNAGAMTDGGTWMGGIVGGSEPVETVGGGSGSGLREAVGCIAEPVEPAGNDLEEAGDSAGYGAETAAPTSAPTSALDSQLYFIRDAVKRLEDDLELVPEEKTFWKKLAEMIMAIFGAKKS